MFQRTKICSGLLIAFGGLAALAPSAFAQDDQAVQRVEITGSSIKRIDAETSVPVTVLKADDLKKQGVTTVEQILQSVAAVQVQTGTTQVVGSGSGGASFADLRGLGANKTLVLLNGRRIANNAFDSSAPDLNMIPFAAIERVEVLRDGASSLYGTDAISGVINFITRKDYRGGTISLGLDKPQHPGGSQHSANIGFGAGDLQKDGINIFGFADFNKTEAIGPTDRDFFNRVLVGTSFTTFPGTYTATTNKPVDPNDLTQGYESVSYTPFHPDCPRDLHLIADSGVDGQCRELTNDFVNYTPAAERISGLLKAEFKLGENHTASIEAFMSQNRTVSDIAPVPYGGLSISAASPYYPGNGITPLPPGVTLLDPTADIRLRYRDLFNGYREDIATNTQYRVVGALEGNLYDWDYTIGASLNSNTVQDYLNHGYTNGDIIGQGVYDGTINPFGPDVSSQTPEGAAMLASAVNKGVLQRGNGTVQQIDGHASHDLGDWFKAGRPAAIALGFEGRHERFLQEANTPFAEKVIASTGIDPNTFNSGWRNVWAGYAEMNVPVLKSLDFTAAVRYDHYSDFGSTTNPKFGFRWQPNKVVLLRGSYSTGFRAPSLFDLNAAPAFTNTGGGQNDPVNCPDGVQTPAQHAAHPFACDNQFMALTGGNTELKPEKSKNTTLGIVLEPLNDLTLEADVYNITFTNQITTLPDSSLFTAENGGPGGKFNQYFHYNAAGDLSTDGSQCPFFPADPATCGYVDERNQNLGGVRTNGIDFAAAYRMNAGSYGRFNFGYHGTWVHKYEFQTEPGGEWIQNVGVFAGTGPIFRWQHNGEVNWNFEPFSVGVAGHYKTGYIDEDPTNKVSGYGTMDLFGTWAMQKGFALTLGIKNVFDRDPPYSNVSDFFQRGYDPRYYDPTGRVFYARGTYSF